MTLEEQALKLYPPLSCYEKEPIEYNRLQAACREAWLRAKREDAAENERLRETLRQIKLKGLTTGYGRAALSHIAHEALNAHQQQAVKE